MKNLKATTALGFFVLVLTLTAAAGAQTGHYNLLTQKMTEPWKALLGKPAPNVKLPLLSGETFDLSSFKGEKVIVMDFWASWCPPCRMSLPVVEEVAQKYKDKDVYFVAVNQGEAKEKVQAFVEANNMKMNVALDSEGTASDAYKVESIPRLVIIGKDRTVQSVYAGLDGRTVDEVKENMRKALSADIDKLLAGQKLVEPEKSQEEPKVTAKK